MSRAGMDDMPGLFMDETEIEEWILTRLSDDYLPQGGADHLWSVELSPQIQRAGMPGDMRDEMQRRYYPNIDRDTLALLIHSFPRFARTVYGLATELSRAV